MKIYHYHPEYKYFIGSSNADESPLEPGIFLIPAHATNIEPIECDEDEIQIFDETSWSIIKDNRGVYYHTQTDEVENTFIGEKFVNNDPRMLPKNVTKTEPPLITTKEKLVWDGSWNIEDIVNPALTAQEKLSLAGLTVEELKSLLGLTP